jgi:GNAT superfamily N-acetyltransferase
MNTIRQASMPEDYAAVHELFAEYLRWVCPRIYEEYQAIFDAESMIVHDMETIGIFLPPQGLLYLAFYDGSLAGCACTRTIGDQVAELKRMYVRPGFRRKAIGRSLVSETIAAVRQLDYSVLRLDSAGFMSEAHALYRSMGFRDRPPYNQSEIPPEYRRHWVFMELCLVDSGSKS